MLLIEQFATVALGLANYAHIMGGGRIRFSGPASELCANPDLLGRRACSAAAPPAPAPGLPSRDRNPGAPRNPLFLDAERTVVPPPGREKPRGVVRPRAAIGP